MTLHLPTADPSRHLGRADLERGLAALAPPPHPGRLRLIVSREEGGRRTPDRVVLDPETGVPGDAWQRRPDRSPEAQVSLMRADVARLLANGQPLSLFGDNLLVDLDLSPDRLPAGARLRLGEAVLEITAKAHTGCRKFAERLGTDAVKLTADPAYAHLRLRGVYARVVHGGAVAVGDAIEVLGLP